MELSSVWRERTAPRGSCSRVQVAVVMWQHERDVRLWRDEIDGLHSKKERFDRGELSEAGFLLGTSKREKPVSEKALEETPRERHERNLLWPSPKRVQIRRRNREGQYQKIDAREKLLEKKIKKAQVKIHSFDALPALHLEAMRRPGVLSDTLCALAQEDPNVRGAYKQHILHLAVQQGDLGVLDMLLASTDCDVNAVDSAGYSPLHYALCNPDRLEVAHRLVKAGGDLTIKNREGLDAIETALSLGLYKPVTRFLDKYSTWEIACMYARRFFENYFAGNPEYHHYRRLEYENAVLLAYVVVMKPNVLRIRLSAKQAVRRVLRKEITMNNTERFFHDFQGNHAFSPGFNDRFTVRTLPQRRIFKLAALVSRIAGKLESRAVQQVEEKGTDADDEDDEFGDMMERQRKEEEEEELEYARLGDVKFAVGLFAEFPLEVVHQWRAAALKWKFSASHQIAHKIAQRAFQGAHTGEEIVQKMRLARFRFEKWRKENKKVLLEDETRRLREVADAVRLRRLREERENKRLAMLKAEEDKKKERAKRGLDKLDKNASVNFSDDKLYYNTDSGEPVEYWIKLGTMPKAPVLIKFDVKTLSNGEASFTISPTLFTFTPKNWNEELYVKLTPLSDDAIVRLKRGVTQKQQCDHKVVHKVQSTTDLSYKHPDLEWKPAKELRLHVF